MSGSSFKIDRRKFMAAAASLSVAGAFYYFRESAFVSPAISTKRKTRLRAGHYHAAQGMDVSGLYLASAYKSRAVFEWNFETGETHKVETQTVVHVVETSPIDDSLSVLATKRTDRMSMFDWNERKEISTRQLSLGEFYYGHAAFTPDGSLVLAPKVDSSGAAWIEALEVPTLRLVESYPVPRGSAHEICSVGGSKFVFSVGQSSNQPPAFVFFDLAGTKFEYVDVPIESEGKSLTMTHLKDCGDRYVGNINVETSSTLLDGAVVSIRKSDHFVKTEIPLSSNGLTTELLSFEYDPVRRFVWVTIPHQSLIVVWNLATDSVAKKIRTPSGAFSVSLLPTLDVVVVASRTGFFAFDPATLERREAFEKKVPNELLNGGKSSHSRLV
ncbi:hypothetical protein BH10BDE1_BH10BDE1_17010 [soil metagenome]